MALRKSIAKIPGMTSSRVTLSDGLYGDYLEPSLDVEFSVQRNKDGSSQNISEQVSEILRIASEQGRKQNDVFVSKVVDENHPNARPMVEIGFKKAASPEDVQAVVQAFRSNGVDGFTIAKDARGNVIGIRSQYIPEISARFDTIGHLDQAKFISFADQWVTNVKKSLSSIEQIDNVSYKNPGWVSTTVYGIEEYSTAKPKDNGRTSRREELDRRRAVLQAGQVPSGAAPVEGVESGAGGLPTAGRDVSGQSTSGASEVGAQRYMPAGDMATGRSVKDHREAMDLFEKGYRLYGALYDGMEDPIRLKKASEIERFDPENLWAVPSKKIAAAISVRNMPASDREVTRAVNINDASQDFTGQILKGQKTIETRDTLNNALQGVLGQRIGITRTGTGNTKVVGYATVAKQPIVYRNEAEFRRDEESHLVAAGSPYDIKKGGVKYGYELTDVVSVEPFAPKSVGRKYSVIEPQRYLSADLMPQPDSSMPGAYSFTGGYRALPGKSKGSLRIYSPAGSLIGIAASLDEAQRIIRKKAKQ
jgi:hypothetical protein